MPPDVPYPTSTTVQLEDLERRIATMESERRDFAVIGERVAVLTERTASQDLKLNELKIDGAAQIAKLEKTYSDALASIRRAMEKDAAEVRRSLTWLTRVVLGTTGVFTVMAVVISKLAGVG